MAKSQYISGIQADHYDISQLLQITAFLLWLQVPPVVLVLLDIQAQQVQEDFSW